MLAMQIRAFGQGGQPTLALELFEEMRGLRVTDACRDAPPPKPSVHTWGMAIAACHANGRHQDALRLFRDMRECGLKPDGHMLEVVISSCEKVGAWEEADEVCPTHKS